MVEKFLSCVLVIDKCILAQNKEIMITWGEYIFMTSFRTQLTHKGFSMLWIQMRVTKQYRTASQHYYGREGLKMCTCYTHKGIQDGFTTLLIIFTSFVF